LYSEENVLIKGRKKREEGDKSQEKAIFQHA